MLTTASRKKFTAACLVLLGCGAATVCNAQLVFKADPADGLVLSGSTVVSWSDTAATPSYTLTPPTTAPTFTAGGVNGQGYVSFSGSPLTDAGVTLNPLVSGDQSATFIVLRNPSADSTVLSWLNDAPPSGPFSSLFQVSRLGTQIAYVQGNVVADTHEATSPTWDGNFHLLTLIRNGTVGEIRFDGAPLPGQTTGFSANSISTTATGTLAIGALPGFDTWSGDIAEIRVYNTVPGDINSIETTLGGEYGLTVVPEPSEYAMIFGLACIGGALALRYRRQTNLAS